MAHSQQQSPVAQMLSAILPTKVESKVRSMSDTLRARRAGYVQTVASSGKASLDSGDAIAVALRGATPQQVLAVAQDVADLAGTKIDLLAKYVGDGGWSAPRLNLGQIRMNSGNRIRGAIKRGDLIEADAISQIEAARA